MATKAKQSTPAAIVKLSEGFLPEGYEVRFGKNDKIQKLPMIWSPADDDPDAGMWKVADLSKGEIPEAVLFVPLEGEPYLVDPRRYPDATKAILLWHGTKQKVGDEYANLDTIADSMEAVRGLDEQLAAGKWFAERQGFSGVSVLMRAIMEVFSQTEEQARAFLKDLDAKEKMALRQSPELKPTIDRIEAEKAKKSPTDTAALLKKLREGAPIGE